MYLTEYLHSHKGRWTLDRARGRTILRITPVYALHYTRRLRERWTLDRSEAYAQDAERLDRTLRWTGCYVYLSHGGKMAWGRERNLPPLTPPPFKHPVTPGRCTIGIGDRDYCRFVF